MKGHVQTASKANIQACIERQEQHIASMRSSHHPLRRMVKSDRHGSIGAWMDCERECLRKLKALIEIKENKQ